LNPRDPASLLPGLPPGSNILIIRLRSLGDVVLLTPSLAALHAWRPDLRLSVLVESACRAALEGNPAVSQIIVTQGFAATAMALRRQHFPVVFNQHGGPRSALLTAATGAPARVCWKGKQFAFLYNVQVPDAVEYYGTLQVHSVEQRMAQFYWAGLPQGPIPPARIYPQPDALNAVSDLLRPRGIADGEGYAVMQPAARFFTMCWPKFHFAELASWLKARGIRTIVNLGPGEGELLGDARSGFEASDSIILDSLDLRELIALIAGARIFVGNDSGPVHLASALGVPAVVVYGSSSSVHWRPWRVAHRVVQNDFPCNPCRGDRCYAFDEPKCILSVSFEQVRDACEALLAETDSGSRTQEQAGVKIEGMRTD
jgi:heptosyltransferase III